FHLTGPTAWMTPLYPYLLAAVFKIFGIYSTASGWAIVFLDSLFSALTSIPIYFIARKTFGQRAAIWAGWCWAFFPYAVYLSADFIWDTTLSTFLASCLIWTTLEIEESPEIILWISLGLIFGLA